MLLFCGFFTRFYSMSRKPQAPFSMSQMGNSRMVCWRWIDMGKNHCNFASDWDMLHLSLESVYAVFYHDSDMLKFGFGREMKSILWGFRKFFFLLLSQHQKAKFLISQLVIIKSNFFFTSMWLKTFGVEWETQQRARSVNKNLNCNQLN